MGFDGPQSSQQKSMPVNAAENLRSQNKKLLSCTTVNEMRRSFKVRLQILGGLARHSAAQFFFDHGVGLDGGSAKYVLVDLSVN
jgi:hypothetical protein